MAPCAGAWQAATEALVLRNVDDPQEIVIILGWHSLQQAQLFTRSVSLQEALKKIGVVGMPDDCYLEKVL